MAGESDQKMRIEKDENDEQMEKRFERMRKRMRMLFFFCSFPFFSFLILFAHQQVCDGEEAERMRMLRKKLKRMRE